MNKNKAKLSLIEDYIKIILINNYFNKTCNFKNSLRLNVIKEQVFKLKCCYEFLFNELKFDSLSILILKKELKNSIYSVVNKNELQATKHILNDIYKIKINLIKSLSIIKKGKFNFPLYLL